MLKDVKTFGNCDSGNYQNLLKQCMKTYLDEKCCEEFRAKKFNIC